MLETIQTIIEIICLIVATYVGVWGLNTWRREMVGRRKAELAEDVLAAFYEARDVFQSVRNPFAFAGEGASRTPVEGETDDEKRTRDALYAVIERLNNHHEYFGKLFALKYRFAAYFGADATLPFKELAEVRAKIISSARYLLRMAHVKYRKETEETIARDEKHENNIYWTDDEDDVLSPCVEDAIRKIEDTCRPYLSEGKM